MKQRAFGLLILVMLSFVGICGVWMWQSKRAYARNRQLIDALEHNDTKTALALVNAGADPNTHLDPPPETSFSNLASLLRYGSMPTIDHYSTAFALACGSGCNIPDAGCVGRQQRTEDVLLIQTMLAHGADVHAHTQMEGSVLAMAVALNRVREAQLLLQHGAYVEERDYRGMTLLMQALNSCSTDMAGLLMAHGANTNVQDRNGDTALHFAVRYLLDAKALPQLLAHGANPNIANQHGQTSIALAHRQKRPGIVRLLKKGAK